VNNAEIVSDFRRRWEGTYVWLFMEKQNEESLVFVEKVADNNDKVATITVNNRKYGGLVLNLGSEEYELRFKYPPVGVFQCGNDSYLFRRRPARQYRRGICADNSLIWNVTRDVVGTRAPFNERSVSAAFEAKKHTLDEALKLLASGYRSVALHNNLSLSLSMDDTSNHVLWHWDVPIARVDKAGKPVVIYEKSYTVEDCLV
jgi:hypothetical protein